MALSLCMRTLRMFFYQEHPFIVEKPRRIGKLTTTQTPADWHGTMFPHFEDWEDAPAGQEISQRG